MLKVYIQDTNIIKSQKDFDTIFALLPKYRQDKINSYKFEKDKLLSLVAGKLLQDAFVELGYPGLDAQIEVDSYGKPYLETNPFYFSISHSGTKVLVVVSDSPVGCDIEYVRENDLSVAKRFFDDSEFLAIENSDQPLEEFFKFWTIKESYLKVVGKGLCFGLNNLVIRGTRLSDENYSFITYKYDENYRISYVTKRKINLIFDCDGTILNSYNAIVDWIYRIFEKMGATCNKEEIYQLCLYKNVDYCVKVLADKFCLNIEDIYKNSEEVKENLELISAYPNLKELITNPRFNSFVYTHRGPSCKAVLDNLGVLKDFIEVVDSTYKLKKKPDPEGIEYLINKYSLDRENTYYVGDRLIDIQCGLNANIKTIFFNSSGLDIDSSKADFVVSNLIDICNLPL